MEISWLWKGVGFSLTVGILVFDIAHAEMDNKRTLWFAKVVEDFWSTDEKMTISWLIQYANDPNVCFVGINLLLIVLITHLCAVVLGGDHTTITHLPTHCGMFFEPS